MRTRQAILACAGLLGAALLGASVNGVTAVDADLEALAPVRQEVREHRVYDGGRDCPFEKRRDKAPAATTEI